MPLVNGYGISAEFAQLDSENVLGTCMVGPLFSFHARDDGDYGHIFEWTDFTAPIWEQDEYQIVGLQDFEPSAVGLLKDNKVVGFYLDGQAWIDLEHRGKGLGPAMVVSFVSMTGNLPHVEDIGFSDEGYRIHLKAIELIRQFAGENVFSPVP